MRPQGFRPIKAREKSTNWLLLGEALFTRDAAESRFGRPLPNKAQVSRSPEQRSLRRGVQHDDPSAELD